METLNQISQNPNFLQNCPKHCDFQLDMILVQKGVENNLICFKCLQDFKINISQVIHIKEIQKIYNETILLNFPPLEDQNLTKVIGDLINFLNFKEMILKINEFFDKLKTQLMVTIDSIQNETKQKIIKLGDLQEQIMDIYNNISSKQDLKDILNLNPQKTHEMMKKFIEEKFNNISINTQKIKEKIDEYTKHFGVIRFDIPLKIQDHVTFMLKQIDFFSHIDIKILGQHVENLSNYLNSGGNQQQKQVDQNNIRLINFIRSSSYKDSQNQNFIRGINNQIEIQKSIKDSFSVSYANFTLDPKKKYIFRILIQSNKQFDNFINIGLIKEQDKDLNSIYQNGLVFNMQGYYNGISNIKRGNIFEGSQKSINKEIEMRINLENKILKVGSFPYYDNVVEVENQTKIEDNQLYRLATELYYLDDKIIITHFEIVDEFENQM